MFSFKRYQRKTENVKAPLYLWGVLFLYLWGVLCIFGTSCVSFERPVREVGFKKQDTLDDPKIHRAPQRNKNRTLLRYKGAITYFQFFLDIF